MNTAYPCLEMLQYQSWKTVEDGKSPIQDRIYTLQDAEDRINVFKDNGSSLAKELYVDWKLTVGAIQKDSHIQNKESGLAIS